MMSQFNIESLLDHSNNTVEKLSENLYKVGEEIIEVLEINFDLKTIRVRHNHSTYSLAFKNNLDRTLDKMGIKRTFESINTDIKAPMPGKVLDVMVEAGESIEKGQPLLILEAMKMENVLKAENDAIIKLVNVNKEESVESGQLLIELEPSV